MKVRKDHGVGGVGHVDIDGGLEVEMKSSVAGPKLSMYAGGFGEDLERTQQ